MKITGILDVPSKSFMSYLPMDVMRFSPRSSEVTSLGMSSGTAVRLRALQSTVVPEQLQAMGQAPHLAMLNTSNHHTWRCSTPRNHASLILPKVIHIC